MAGVSGFGAGRGDTAASTPGGAGGLPLEQPSMPTTTMARSLALHFVPRGLLDKLGTNVKPLFMALF